MTSNSLRHIAIIMDGNNRWAKQRGLSGVAGHKVGAERIRDIMTACQDLGIKCSPCSRSAVKTGSVPKKKWKP